MPDFSTPMLRQYTDIKKKYQDAILFFRLGDFYEMFMEDAETASRILEITLTSREAGNDKRIAMCGVPYHAANSYLVKLLHAGYKVAICEQVEDPSLAKGIVKREVVRVVSPGTIAEPEMLEGGKNNYFACIYHTSEGIGFAYADLSTGEFKTTSFMHSSAAQLLMDELSRIAPVECLAPAGSETESLYISIRQSFPNLRWEYIHPDNFNYVRAYAFLTDHFRTQSLHPYGCENDILAVASAGSLLAYLKANNKTELAHFTALARYDCSSYMILDANTRRNLELTKSLRDGEKVKSLYGVLDQTVTAMGARLLRKWLEQPLLSKDDIVQRLDAVEEISGNFIMLQEILPLLKNMYDLERILGKIHGSSANARDLLALCQSFERIPPLRKILETAGCRLLRTVYERLNNLPELTGLLKAALRDDPPFSITEGHMIREGFSEELDQLLLSSREGKNWIAELESNEKEKTGIKSLKISYNQVFGYYIEVTRANLSLVPPHYHRKQTLANAERYITDKLKHLEDLVLGAQDKIVALEQEIFQSLRRETVKHTAAIQQNAELLAVLDVLSSYALVARKEHYVRPVVDESGILKIKDGRHPVVEKAGLKGGFIPNDAYLDPCDYRLHVITGPNMAGKSTYMRQIALIVLMAQIGSFVPAGEASLGIVDRIFTRVGASDDLATGQSTFMVEMNELSFILHHATAKSLIILDEIGRGTSTFDGLSIAWAAVEYINERIKAKTLFATHYHELTELEEKLPGVKNFNVAVEEAGGDIIFLRKIVPGGASESYGIEVARLAGLPPEILLRAKEILLLLEEKNNTGPLESEKKSVLKNSGRGQLNLFPSSDGDFLQELLNLNLITMTPLEALNFLHRWQQKASEKTSRAR
ncbi:MAG: DNA mismatch repair protein MutS [Bacillota bacterium]